MPVLNSQVGKPLITRVPPSFDGYEVVDGTWKPKDLLGDQMTKNARSVGFNVTFVGPGVQVECELVQYLTDPVTEDLAKSQVIHESAVAPAVGKPWLVLKADMINFGGNPLHFQCTLLSTPDLDLAQTTPVVP